MGGEEQTSVAVANNGGQYNQGINLRKLTFLIIVIFRLSLPMKIMVFKKTK